MAESIELALYKQHGLSPQEVLFQKALRDTAALIRSRGLPSKIGFVSYAWEEDEAENEKLQAWLRRLSKDLETLGVKVLLDIEGMNGKMANWMEQGIAQSDFIVLVGTPRYKQRAAQETNVAFEFQNIMNKLQSASECLLLPILYSGDFAISFPNGVTEHLIRDFRNAEQYYNLMLGLVKPLGVIPNMYSELAKTGPYSQEYLWLYESFDNKFASLQAEIRNMKANKSLSPVPDKLLPSSPYFVGRKKELVNLKQLFKTSSKSATVAIQGIGGAGKSQLAAEFAHSINTSDVPYRLTRWLKADSEENIKNSYFALGDDLGIDRKNYQNSDEGLANAISRQLLLYERVLLIYDNVESIEHIQKYQPSAGAEATVHLLLTTRYRFIDCPTVEVKEFNSEEVQIYLNQRLNKDISVDLAEQLGRDLGYLPLAIVQSASYMVKYAKSLDSFIKLLQSENRQKVLDNADTKAQTVGTLWSMTLSKLSASSLQVIRLCSFLDPDNIPQVLLEQMVKESERDEILFELRSQSLLTDAAEDHFRIHRLLQEAVRRELLTTDSSQAKTIIEKAVESMQIVITAGLGTGVYLFWKNHNSLQVQVNQLIQEGQQLKISNPLFALLLEWAGDYRQVVTLKFQDSLNLYQRSLDIRKAAYGENHPDIATSFNNIGSIYNNQGQYDKALECYHQSLTIYKATYGNNHPAIASSLNNIGSAYDFRGQYDKALEYHQQSLAIYKATSGDNHPSVATSLGNIGNVYKSQGQFDKALECYQQSLAICKTIYGENHPVVATTLNNIGLICYSTAQYDNAIEYYQRSLAIKQIIYGGNHPSVATSLNNIGGFYLSQGQYDKALEYHQKALTMRKAIYGDSHPAIATSLDNIGEIYRAQGQHNKALEYYQQSLAIRRATFGDNHPETLQSINNIQIVTQKTAPSAPSNAETRAGCCIIV